MGLRECMTRSRLRECKVDNVAVELPMLSHYDDMYTEG